MQFLPEFLSFQKYVFHVSNHQNDRSIPKDRICTNKNLQNSWQIIQKQILQVPRKQQHRCGKGPQFWNNISNNSKPIMQNVEAYFYEAQITTESPTYFIHPHNNYWEVQVNAQNVAYRAGKLRNKQEATSEKVEKRYSSDYAAKMVVKEKIREKLIKGYILLDGSKSFVQSIKPKAQPIIQKTVEDKATKSKKQMKSEKKKIKSILSKLDERINLSNSSNNILSGSSQKINEETRFPQSSQNQPGNQVTHLINKILKEAVKYEIISENKVQVTKYLQEKDCGYEIRSFSTKEETMKFIFGERQWLKSQGYSEEPVGLKKQELKSVTKVQNASLKIQQNLLKTQPGKKPKSKTGSLVERTDQSLFQRKRLLYFNNQGVINKQQPMFGPPSNGMAIKLMLAETWKEGADPKGWFISEKLDGVRCYWTGTQMYSRNGNKFAFPNYFVRNWPKAQLDGELFIGRGKFSHTMSAVKRNFPNDILWEQVRFLVFDAPGMKCAFKQRYRIMKEVISKIDNPYIKCHYHRQCKGFQDLFRELDHINKVEGQGLMIRDPQSTYEFRRSKSLLKVKTFHDDQATILGYNEGTGRFVGHVGSLKCVNKAGAHFDVGSGLNDEMRFNPPKIGQRIVYKYQQLNKDTGRPRFPTFLRMFQDQNTKDITNSGMGWVRDEENEVDD